jgi:hypothetical protein
MCLCSMTAHCRSAGDKTLSVPNESEALQRPINQCFEIPTDTRHNLFNTNADSYDSMHASPPPDSPPLRHSEEPGGGVRSSQKRRGSIRRLDDDYPSPAF